MRIVWFDDAVNDLNDIYLFRAQESEKSAVEFYNKTLGEVDKLITLPLMGTIEPSLNDDAPIYRFLLIDKTHKVIYKADTDNETIYIFVVWDCRQNPETLKKLVTKRK